MDTTTADVHTRAYKGCNTTFNSKPSFSDSCDLCLFTLISSKAHPQNAIPVESRGPFAESSKSPQVLPTIVPARYVDFGKSALDHDHDHDLDLDKPGEVSR